MNNQPFITREKVLALNREAIERNISLEELCVEVFDSDIAEEDYILLGNLVEEIKNNSPSSAPPPARSSSSDSYSGGPVARPGDLQRRRYKNNFKKDIP